MTEPERRLELDRMGNYCVFRFKKSGRENGNVLEMDHGDGGITAWINGTFKNDQF